VPVFQLTSDLIFPAAHLASEEGVLAVGGDLSSERLLLAYCNGIFPWYIEGEPIMWWSPDPRLVLYPEQLHVSKSMKQVLRNNRFQITFDTDFKSVIGHCAEVSRKDQTSQDGWITDDMMHAYTRLFHMGFAHSVEVREKGQLVGGLYGVAIGACFFGESMFSTQSNASKAGFITLVGELQKRDFQMIDCQVTTDHLVSLGAEEITRDQFLQEIKGAVSKAENVGSWSEWLNSK